MITQLDARMLSSFWLFVDHEIQRQGAAFVNKGGLFYPSTNKVAGLYTYACSYKQLCNDTSISGANILSGVSLNGNFVTIGQSGLNSINHYDGTVTFSSQLPTSTVVSGNFAVKDFSVYISDEPDYKVLMETKFHTNPKYAQQATGVALDAKTMPGIFLVPKQRVNDPIAFGGIDDNALTLRAVVLCENISQRINVCNILANLKWKPFALIGATQLDYLGNMTGVNYNYNSCTPHGYYAPFVHEAKVLYPSPRSEYVDILKNVATVDFELSCWGAHP